MQLLRIKLENWRGVEAAEIQLDSGITIVEGDNEAGKSSFIEALNLLFRERDSTKKQDLKRVTPKGVDTGSRVEVEFTTGLYHLTYSKTFNKKTATTLFVHKPSSTQLVGAEAHDRVLQILDETIDFSLWQAIQLEQGGEFTQVNFKNSDSLAQALDNAAGGSGAGDGESALLEKAKREYLKYFTEKAGKESGELASLRQQSKALAESAKSVADSLAALETYVDDSTRIDSQLLLLREQLPSIQLKLAEHEKQRAQIDTLQQQLKAAQAQLKTCELGLKDIERQISERVILKDELSSLHKRIDSESRKEAELRHLFEKTNGALDVASVERDQLLTDRQAAERQLRAVEFSVKLRDKRLQLQQLQQQLVHVQAGYKELTELETELAAIRVDDVSVNRIEKLEQTRREQQVQIRGNSAEIRLHFLKNSQLDDGSEKQIYVAGDEFFVDSSKKSMLTVDKSLKLEITPAADSFELSLAHEKTVESLGDLLSDCGVTTVGEAIAAHRKRSELTVRLREVKRGYKKLSKEQSIEGLLKTIDICKKSIHDLQTVPTPDTLNADYTEQSCQQQLETLEQSLASARDRRDQLQQQCASAKTSFDVCVQGVVANKQQLETCENKIAALEADLSSDKLRLLHMKTLEEQKAAETVLRRVAASVENSQSAQIELLVDNARQSLQRAQSDLRDLELSQADLKARLDQMQSEGLHEKHQMVLAELSDNANRLKQFSTRARAAEKLWTTLCNHQRQAQLSYARPLAERVAMMGKIVFGADFSVELSESLSIVSRTLNGTTVPFDDLSGGAREQLGILLRLAAAQLVSQSEAMPLILDDTLGHTDSRRLETMGAILNGAAQNSQIIVMTCYPARYSFVGTAKVVKLLRSDDVLGV